MLEHVKVALLTESQILLLAEHAAEKAASRVLRTMEPTKKGTASGRFWTTAKLASELGVSRTTLWRWRKGGLRSSVTGNTILYLWADVEEFLASRPGAPPARAANY